MPSKAVDVAWHEFMVHTAAYQEWCALALERFLHHTPAEAVRAKADRNDGPRRTWFGPAATKASTYTCPRACYLLFALDAKLGIAGVFTYVPDCSDIGRKSDRNGNGIDSFCCGSFSDYSVSGSSGDFGNAGALTDGDSDARNGGGN